MKRIVSSMCFVTLILCLVLCCFLSVMLVACNAETNDINSPIIGGETTTPGAPVGNKILVAYFSWSSSGNTERMAKYIADKTDATIYEIVPLVPYPTEYTPTTEVAKEEKDSNTRPEIKNPIDVSTYDHIFVGFPIWWHTAPMIIGTFLESYSLDGKDVYPFFQGADNSNSSYYTETMAFINKCAPSANVHDGLYAAATDTAKIDAYLDAIDFSPKADITEPMPTERQTIYLWNDDKIPAWRGNLNSNDPADFRPHILTYPAQGEIKGAILICPGGAFQFKSMQPEGYSVAERLSALGYQCFIVSYRLSPYSQAESSLDLARAVRYVRYNAKAYGIEEKDIAIVGFSAGGILCGEHALNWKGTVSPALLDSNYVPDIIDGVNADVAAVGHIYSFYGRLSVSNNNVNTLRQGNLPPTFYAYGTRDPFYSQFNQNVEATKQAGVTVESHVFNGQPHGFGAGNANSNWIPLFDAFLTKIFEPYQGSTIPVDGEKYNVSSVYMEIMIVAGNNIMNAVLFDNKTARAVANMLPLTVSTWHPAPDFARAFDLPHSFSYFEDESPQMSYELGSLAYWAPGPSIAMIYNASRTQTVVPVVPIGKITSNLSVLENYSGMISIAKKY